MRPSSNYLVVLAGGSGTRLWPLSRKNFPKQFLKVASSESLVKETVTRLKSLIPLQQVLIVCGLDHADLMKKEFPEFSPEQFLLEPCGRNTAPAIALAAKVLLQKDAQASMVVLPSDHKIPPSSQAAFEKIISQALRYAHERGGLITLGIEPLYAATGYGYIHRGDPLEGDLFSVKEFREKPDLESAKKYYASGEYFWNSGMFVWKASEFLNNYKNYFPLDAASLEALPATVGSSEWPQKLSEIYPQLTSISVDYAILEKSKSVYMMKASFEWDDVGSLKSLYKYFLKKGESNACEGKGVSIDASGNLLMSDEGMIACLGLDHLVVIRNKDSVLVLPMERSEEVKSLLEEMKRKNLDKHL